MGKDPHHMDDKRSGSSIQTERSIGWLIYRKPDYVRNRVFADRLVSAAGRHGLLLLPVMHEEVRYGVEDSRLFISTGGLEGLPAFAIQRAMDPFLAGHMEKMGVRVYNRSAISAMCNDKAWTYQSVAALGVPMLQTWFADRSSLMNGINPHISQVNQPGPDNKPGPDNITGHDTQTNPMILSGHKNNDDLDFYPWPVVIKTVGGRGGAEVYLAMDAIMLAEMIRDILSEGRYVVQPLCGRPGTDIRVFVVGREPIAAIRRQSVIEGMAGFKANFSMGGKAELYKLNDTELHIVKKIAEAFQFDYVGIDFLMDANGQFLFNEIEDAAGSRTLSICSDIDIADSFLAHVARTMKS